MNFTYLIFGTAFLMEAIGTYVSVVGLSAFFAGDPVILTMGIILDIAKVVSISFLYQKWDKTSTLKKTYLIAAISVLMTITSAGAFGYLSGAFQTALQPNKEVQISLDSIQKELPALISEKTFLSESKLKIETQINNLPANSIIGRSKLMERFKPEEDRINARTQVLNSKIDELQSKQRDLELSMIKHNVHAGPVVYVAEAFHTTTDQASKWVILLIIFVFDPLAVMLIIAGNSLVKETLEIKPKRKYTKRKGVMTKNTNETIVEPSKPLPDTVKTKKKPVKKNKQESTLQFPLHLDATGTKTNDALFSQHHILSQQRSLYDNKE
jgi:hypothetical protein